MQVQRLWLPIGVSAVLHFAVLSWILESSPRSIATGGNPPILATLLGRQGTELGSVTRLTQSAVMGRSIASGEGEVAPSAVQEVRPRDRSVYESSDLDAGVVPLTELQLEPEYGFADDVAGSVDISVLVGPDGRALMVWSSQTSLDMNAVSYMFGALGGASFSPPRKAGLAVYGIFRIHVEVGGAGAIR